jgi:serine phosphatase RsbU (regulator of sigma subunit)
MKKIIAWISVFFGISLLGITIYLSIFQKIATGDMLIWIILAFMFSFIGISTTWLSKSYEKKRTIRKYFLILLAVLLILTIIFYYHNTYFYWFYLSSVLFFSFGITPLNASIRIKKWTNYVDSKLTLNLLCYADYLGIILLTLGLSWKTMHWPLANQLILIGVILLIVAALSWNKIFRRQIDLRIVAENELKEKNQEIMDSINYAQRIQHSFLATQQLLNQNLGEHFIYFNPKEAISGDFYWAAKLNNGNFAMVNADSTGHGVPGAIMSILNVSAIEKAVENNATNPADIFNQTRKTIIERLKKDGSKEGGKDGMDASLISFNSDKSKMTYVAAQNPIWVIRNGELTEIKPEKMPVGKHDKEHVPFNGGEYDIQKGDQIYTLTDGFQDQFGGPKGKKFMVKKMREYVLSISSLSMAEQHQRITDTFSNWKGDVEQVDDVCVIGVRI